MRRMAAVILPDALDDLRRQVDALESRAEALVRPLSDTQVAWQPGDGTRWSIGQCLEHLCVTESAYLEGVAEAVSLALRRGVGPFAGLAPTLVGRRFVRGLEPPPQFRVPAPPRIRPQAHGAGEPGYARERLAVYRASHEPYRALLESCAGVDVNRITVPNAFVPGLRMRVATVLLVLPAHGRRHLWQAEQVSQDPAFPR
jgi:hypothetical protein